MFENHTRVIAKRCETTQLWTSHRFRWDSDQVSEPTPPEEGVLIERLRKDARPSLSVREAARRAGFSEGRWRQIAKGYNQASKEVRVPVRAPAETLARMARVVGATPDQLREVGREDAADELERLMTVREVIAYQRAGGTLQTSDGRLGRGLANIVPTERATPHADHFDRAERLLRHSRESAAHGDYLGAINSLEGVESTVELLIDRLTDFELSAGTSPAAPDPVPGLALVTATADSFRTETTLPDNAPGDDQGEVGPDEAIAAADKAARTGNSLGRQLRDAQDADAETPAQGEAPDGGA